MAAKYWYTPAEIKALEVKVCLGDILEFRRSWLHLFLHWGIYVGQYQDIEHAVIYIDVVGRPFFMRNHPSFEIRADTIEKILGGSGQVRINNSIDNYQKPSDPLSISETAKKMHQAKQPMKWNYSSVSLNSKDFVYSCRYCTEETKLITSPMGLGRPSAREFTTGETHKHKTEAGETSMATKSSPLLTWLLTTPKTSQDTKPQRSQEWSQIKIKDSEEEMLSIKAEEQHGHEAKACDTYMATGSISSVMTSKTTQEVKPEEIMLSGKANEEREVQARDASTSIGGSSSMMPSQTTQKTSKDTNVQRSQDPSYLQLVLEEVNKLNKKLTASERLDWRLQHPYIAVGNFNEKGGSLSLDEYGVHLTIPSGAIAPGFPQQVYIYVDPLAPPNNAAEPTVTFSPNVECGPERLRFKDSVVLSFPHHADVKSKNSETLSPRMCQDNDSSERWEEFDGNAVITEDRVILLVNHFTRFNLSGRSSKRLVVVSYGDVFDPRQGKYQIRVYILNDDKKAKKNVEKDEKYSQKLDGFKNLSWGEGDLAVKLSKLPQECTVFEGETQTIHENQIKRHASNCVTFTLGLPNWSAEDVLYCAVQIYQYCEDEDKREQGKVQLSICPDHTVSSCFSKQPSQNSATGTSSDLARTSFSDTYKQVEQLLDTRNDNGDNSRQCLTVNRNTLVFIFKTDGENTSTLCHKISQEICRAKTEEEKMSRRKVVDDSTLHTLACELGPEWERLATFLGFGVSDIYKFKNDNPHVTNNQIFQMLVKWRDEQYLKELVDCLGRELTKVNRGEMAKTLRDIDDSSLREVSNQLGSDWEILATALVCDTGKVKNEFPYDSREHCFQMLVEWREKQLSPKFQIDKLCKELKRVDREELADNLRELISDRDCKKPRLQEKPQIREQASGDHASAIVSSQPCMKTNYSQEELVSDRDPEKTQLLKKPQVKEQAGGDHASAIGSEPPCTKTKISQEETISVTDPEKPPLLEKPQVLEQATGDYAGAIDRSEPCMETNNGLEELVSDREPEKTQLFKIPQVKEQADGDHASGIGSEPPCTINKNSQEEPISDTDPEKRQLPEKPQTMELRESGGNHASAIGCNQQCLNAKCSELISDRVSEKAQILENCAIACSIGGDPCPQLNYSLKAPGILENTREGKVQPHSHQQQLAVNMRE